MKHFLRLMGQLCPISSLYKTKLSVLVAVMSLFMCLIAAKQVSAQQAEPAAAAGTLQLTERDINLPKVIRKNFDNSRHEASVFKSFPDADLNRFPLVEYHVESAENFVGLSIGDTIPDTIWDLPLWAVNTPGDLDTISLRMFKDSKLLILDFWASWCAPCVASMDKWEEYAQNLGNEVKLIGVHLDFDYKALPFAQRKDWKSPQVIGEGSYILNRQFFDRNVVSRMAWIQDGRLIAITSGRGYYLQTVDDVVAKRPTDIPMDLNWTYQSDTSSKQ